MFFWSSSRGASWWGNHPTVKWDHFPKGRGQVFFLKNMKSAARFLWNPAWKGHQTYQNLHPGRWTAGTYKSPIWKGKWSSKAPWLCSMLIFRGVFESTTEGDSSSFSKPKGSFMLMVCCFTFTFRSITISGVHSDIVFPTCFSRNS